MDKLFQECYTSRLSETGYMLPFFWQHGEDHETLKAEMDAIRNSGANEFCVESRTHEEFCKEQWWEDFRFMLEYARQRGMRVWLLDDKRFPTGYANGTVDALPADSPLRRKDLRLEYRDFVGPTVHTRIPLVRRKEGETIVAVSGWKRGEDFTEVVGQPVDLTEKVTGDFLDWDVPEGIWRVYYVIRTPITAYRGHYIDMLNPESCKALIEGVYQPHYEHFKDYFGNTFRGFFSDEPGFQSSHGPYHDTVGVDGLQFPWRDDLPELIAAEIGKTADEVRVYLPALWHTLPAFAPAVRAGYMDAVTKLYDENFCKMLGDWCRERKVLYIGHVIEDNNSHQRLGFSAGHYFRSLRGQDMAGIDIVLHQMLPKNPDTVHTAQLGGKKADPHFFYYLLGKLAASLAHTHPHMENRAMIEIFGAFGFAAGVGHMKYMADHFLACGLNHFVPHAFTPKYPDPDCPPHFHCHGLNPQEEAFGRLIRYMQKIARLTDESVHKADVAVFYNPEAEWTGGKNTLCQETCTRLTKHQIDYDVLPEDILVEAEVADGRLSVNQETYGALIVPYCQILPEKILASFARLTEEGLPVIYEEGAPEKTACGKDAKEILGEVTVVAPENLADLLRKTDLYHVLPEKEAPYLRTYRVDRDQTTVYLLFNEGIAEIDEKVTFRGAETPVFFDVWNNRVTKPESDGDTVRIQLAGGEAIVLLCGEGRDALPHNYNKNATKPLAPVWKISRKNAGEETWTDAGEATELLPYNVAENLPDFCGTVKYEAIFSADGNETTLDLGTVGEIASVTLNGRSCGLCVAAPYRFEIGKAVKAGENTLTVEVVNNPVYREIENDRFSTYLTVSAGGLLGPVKIG